ncbi:hypothetical protein [Deinococcus daejeonensis]|uniref:hypothetical protein n=1 Tax=Deinococcus daejeonensis TaxID=1007098 RepID=UPI0016679DFA|nr:hypothetical protein [Deinococcus daejeonensis]
MARRSPFSVTGAFVTLPHGSRVHVDPVSRTWTPEWRSVTDERDLVPCRALQAALEALPLPLDRRAVAEVVAAHGAGPAALGGDAPASGPCPAAPVDATRLAGVRQPHRVPAGHA